MVRAPTPLTPHHQSIGGRDSEKKIEYHKENKTYFSCILDLNNVYLLKTTITLITEFSDYR